VGITNGDTLMATIVGGTVTAYINGVQKIQITDPHPFSSGSPGIGFYLENSRGNPAPQAEYGFSSFRATDDLTESTISVRPSSQPWALSNAWMHGFSSTEMTMAFCGRPTRTNHIGSLGDDFGVGRNAPNASLLQADSELTQLRHTSSSLMSLSALAKSIPLIRFAEGLSHGMQLLWP
jgi:hypothetical protein